MIECAVKDYTAIIDSPCGMLGIMDANDVLQAINFLYDGAKPRSPCSQLADKTAVQLEKFFSDPNFQFNLPLAESVTLFQSQARQALLGIPVGETMSYGNVAKTMKSSARAIAGACRRNPLPIIVPCHRVVAVNGLGGFSGAVDGKPLRVKEWLLKHESACK